jgi:hypothetical protein
MEGLATHVGFESCEAVRKFSLEALTEESVGQVLSRESKHIQRTGASRGADAVKECGRPQSQRRHGKVLSSSARSETLCMHGNSTRENRESPCLSEAMVALDRIEKSKDVMR